MVQPGELAKGRKTNTSKQHPRPVVPALPLHFSKRKTAGATNGRSPDVFVSQSSTANSPRTAVEPVISAQVGRGSLGPQTCQNKPGHKHEGANGEGLKAANFDPAKQQSNGAVASSSSHCSSNQPNGVSRTIQLDKVQSTLKDKQLEHSSKVLGIDKAMDAQNGMKGFPGELERNANADGGRLPATIAQQQRVHMPPPLQVTNRPYAVMNNWDFVHGPRGVPPPHAPNQAYQNIPNGGAAHSSNLQNSQNTSPAPPHHSRAFMPPPAMSATDGRPTYLPPTATGYPPMVPYGADMMQPATFDQFGRPTVLSFAPLESFPTYGAVNNFSPSTPQSSYDAQVGGQSEDNKAMYPSFPPPAPLSGPEGTANSDRTPSRTPSLHDRIFLPPGQGGMVPGYGLPLRMEPYDDGDGLAWFIRQQFASPEFVDCELHMEYSSGRAAPTRIPGHRLIFARSGALYALLQKLPPPKPGAGVPVLHLETGSRWIRPDSFYMAVQRLYGLPLLPLTSRGRIETSGLADAGTMDEQLDFALSYAAAGHVLNWSPIVQRGCEVATQLLAWHTAERLLEFALEDHVDTGLSASFKYGEGSMIILDAVVAFLGQNLPPAFNVDTSFKDPKGYARLPDCPSSPKVSKTSNPVIARGSSVVLSRQGRRSQQITGIQFGDLSIDEGPNGHNTDAEQSEAAGRQQPVQHAILSRILINLPFGQLKHVLGSTSGAGGVNGSAIRELYDRLIRTAVNEREVRRLRLLDAVMRGRVLGDQNERAALGRALPQDIGRWSILGWQEQIIDGKNTDGPTLERKWVPVLDAVDEASAMYP